MSTAYRTLLISGWAHDGSALAPLAVRLGDASRPWCFSLAELESAPAGSAGLSPLAGSLAGHIAESAIPVELIGWSTGAMLALEVAKRIPEKICRLVLLSGTPKFCADETWRAGVPAANLRAMVIGMGKMPEPTLAGFFKLAASPRRIPPAELAGLTALALAQGERRLGKQLRYLMQCDLRDGLAGMRVPTLLLHGEQDAVVPCQAAEWLADRLPDAKLEILPGQGHALPASCPEILAGKICGFRNPGRGAA